MIKDDKLYTLINKLNDQVGNYSIYNSSSLVIKEAIFDSIIYRYVNSFNKTISVIKDYLINTLDLPEIDYGQKSVLLLSCKYDIIKKSVLKEWLVFLKIKKNVMQYINDNLLVF